MSEIKFRAWDEINHVMRPVQRISFRDSGTTILIEFLNKEDGSFDYGLVDGNNGYLMQFTGLHDENGKEIYEGDVLRRSKDKENYHFVVVINFSNGSFRGTTYPAAGDGPYTWDLVTAMEKKGAEYDEVIGNIYENPELCK